MPKVGIVNFDDQGNLHTNVVTVTKEELGVNCWLPAHLQVCREGKLPSRSVQDRQGEGRA